jgi:hypothetical protein
VTVGSTNGQQFDHILSGGPSQPLTCSRAVNGAPAAPGAGDICGELIEPNTIHMVIDMSALAPGTSPGRSALSRLARTDCVAATTIRVMTSSS